MFNLKFLSRLFFFPLISYFAENEGGGEGNDNADVEEGVEEDEDAEKGDSGDGGNSGEDSQPKTKTPDELQAQIDTLMARLKDNEDKSQATISAMQRRINQLTAQKKEAESKSNRGRRWEDLSIEELVEYREKAKDAGEEKLFDYINDIIVEKKIQRGIKKEADTREANYIRAATWNEVLKDFPDLKDVNSEHYKETVKYIEEHKVYDDVLKFPEGHAEAAKIVADRMTVSKLRGADKDKSAAERKRLKTEKKLNLGADSRKASEVDNIEKLRKAAENSGDPMSREWRTYFAALEKRDSANKK